MFVYSAVIFDKQPQLSLNTNTKSICTTFILLSHIHYAQINA